jgi:fructosamine-3-kinase
MQYNSKWWNWKQIIIKKRIKYRNKAIKSKKIKLNKMPRDEIKKKLQKALKAK